MRDKIFIRDDFKESFTGIYDENLHQWFIDQLITIFEDDLQESVIVKRVDEQLASIPTFTHPSISLDKYFTGDFQLDASRHFRIGDHIQEHGYKLDCTTKSLTDEIQKIKERGFDNVILVDDDSVSGETVRRIKDLLDVNIIDTYFISPGYKDVLDVRDFLLNAKNGGLVFSDSETIFRAPYIHPYVNLQKRALFNNPEEVTRRVLNLNKELYQNQPVKMEPLFQSFLDYYGKTFENILNGDWKLIDTGLHQVYTTVNLV